MGELERAKFEDVESILTQGAVPELLFALAVLSPDREKALSVYLERAEARRRRRAVEFEQEVLKHANLSEEELLQRILNDEAAAELFEQAVLRAIATAEEKKRKALARAVACGLLAEDAASLDATQLQMRAIGALEPAHIRVLLIIGNFRAPFTGSHADPMNFLMKELAWAGPALSPMISELQGRGLLNKKAHPKWTLTPFGKSVLDLLKET
jgi:hypothetical protein